ncbi:MAG: hypothetical protein WCW03_03105 [Candidatus Paceibacterota bacterium]|jgi:hypothetical protein
MRTLTLRILGTTPLILHRISRHELREQIASDASKGILFEQEALENMSKDDDGNPVVPVSWLWDAIRKGCSKITVDGGSQLSFVRLQQVLHLPSGSIPLRKRNQHLDREWEVYTSVQHASPGSKKMITVVAPMFRHWMLEGSVAVDGNQYDDYLLQRVFNEAGKVGMGLFHPPKKQFGKFTTFVTPSDVRLSQVKLGAVRSSLER